MTGRTSTSDAPFGVRLRLARAALLWERVWPACWPALAALGIFFVLALFDLLPGLPGLLHAGVLLALGAAFLLGVGSALRDLVIPDNRAARRRIEQASGLRHRPLQALADQPSSTLDSPAAALWQAHLRRMKAAARRLRIGVPRAGFAPRDPWGLRAVLAIFLLIGVLDAGADWRERIGQALAPNLAGGSAEFAAKSGHLGHPAGVHRAGAAVFAAGDGRDHRHSDRQQASRASAWRAIGPAPRDQ